jgi:hypothetical protein
MSNLVRSLSCLSLALVFAACGDDTTGPGDNGRQILANPSFATDVNEIFQRKGCSAASGCHGAPNGQGALRLTASAVDNYTAIVNVPADLEAFDLVEPGNADDSYIVIKVEGRQTQGQTMPFGGTELDAIDLGNLRNWINNGAPNN